MLKFGNSTTEVDLTTPLNESDELPSENRSWNQWIQENGMALINVYDSKKPELSLLPLLSFITQIPSALDDRSTSSTFIQGLLCTLPVRLLSLFQKREDNQSWEKALTATLIEGLRDFGTLAALYGIKEVANIPGIFGSKMSANVINDFVPEDLQVRFEEESYDYYMVLAWTLALSANILRNGVERYRERNINNQSAERSEEAAKTLFNEIAQFSKEIALPSVLQGTVETVVSLGINCLWHELVVQFPSYRPREYHKLENPELHPSAYQEVNGFSVNSCQEPDSLSRNYYSGHTSSAFATAVPAFNLASTVNKKAEITETARTEDNPIQQPLENDEEKQEMSSVSQDSENSSSYYDSILGMVSWGFATASGVAAFGTGVLRVLSTCHSFAAVTQGALQGSVASHLGKEATKIVYAAGSSFFAKEKVETENRKSELSVEIMSKKITQ